MASINIIQGDTMCNKEKLKLVTDDVVKAVLSVTDDVMKIILYGSQARGDNTEGSDIDILVVLDMPNEKIYPLKKLMWKRTNDISLDRDEVVSLVVSSSNEYSKMKNTLFYKNVAKDGVELYGRAK